MSQPPPEVRAWPRAAAAADALRRRLTLRSARAPLHTLFVHAHGAWAWAPDADAAAAPDAYADVESWCVTHRESQARIVVSDQLVHNLVAEPGLPLRDDAALRSYARQQFVHYHGIAAQHWPIALWDAHARGACALHGVDMDVIRRVGDAHRVRWAGLSAAWPDALRAAASRLGDLTRRERAGLLCVEGVHVTCLLVERGRVTQLRQRYMDGPTRASLLDMLGAFNDEMHFTQPPILTGWGIEDAVDASSLPCTVMGRIDARHPSFDALAPTPRQRGIRPWA